MDKSQNNGVWNCSAVVFIVFQLLWTLTLISCYQGQKKKKNKNSQAQEILVEGRRNRTRAFTYLPS